MKISEKGKENLKSEKSEGEKKWKKWGEKWWKSGPRMSEMVPKSQKWSKNIQ